MSIVNVNRADAAFRVGTGERAVDVGGGRLFLIAGPCVIESRESSLLHAERLARISDESGVPIVFKSSFDKANRTSHASFRGPGQDEGLAILAEVRRATGMPVVTDVHETVQVAATAEVADLLQIPALLCRQTDLLLAAARVLHAEAAKRGAVADAGRVTRTQLEAIRAYAARAPLGLSPAASAQLAMYLALD